MRRTALFAASIAVLTIGEAQAYAAREIGGWQVSVNDHGVCTMTAAYNYSQPGVSSAMTMAVTDGRKVLQVVPFRSDWRLPTGTAYDVKVSVDRLWQSGGKAKVLGQSQFSVYLPVSEALVLAVMQGQEMRIETDRAVLKYTLQGTERAMPELLRCALAQEQGTSPFSPAGNDPTPF